MPTLWRVLVACYAVLFVVLAITGTMLVFVYRPLPEGAMTPDRYLRLAHVAVADLATAGALPTLLIGAILTLSTRRPRRQFLPLAAALCGLVFAGTFTGALLPWDQVAAFARPGERALGGYLAFFSGRDIRFVQIGGVEVAPGTLRTWLLMHLVVGAAAVVVPATAWLRGRRRALEGSVESPA